MVLMEPPRLFHQLAKEFLLCHIGLHIVVFCFA